jgi:Arf-GAP with Rho-GAP domain, ANK repeat and PH domain-containing protein 1
MNAVSAKTEAYVELLQRLPRIDYQTLRKIVGHLNFVQSQAEHNRMTSQNLAIVWGGNLLRDPQAEDTEYSEEEANVVQNLIDFYKDLFHPTFEELEEERKLLAMLEQYYTLQNDLPDDNQMDVIDNLKVWIKYSESPDAADEDKALFHITLTSCKTVYDICKEIAAEINFRPDQLTLSEHILDNYLERPMHYEEIALDTVLRWSEWAEDDRRNNHLEMRLAGLFTELASQPQTMPQNLQLKFADSRSKALSLFTVVLLDDNLRILKESRHEYEKYKKLVLRDYFVYLGSERKRCLTTRSWGITFLRKRFRKR